MKVEDDIITLRREGTRSSNDEIATGLFGSDHHMKTDCDAIIHVDDLIVVVGRRSGNCTSYQQPKDDIQRWDELAEQLLMSYLSVSVKAVQNHERITVGNDVAQRPDALYATVMSLGFGPSNKEFCDPLFLPTVIPGRDSGLKDS